jgi:hypothetical protein
MVSLALVKKPKPQFVLFSEVLPNSSQTQLNRDKTIRVSQVKA